MFGHPSYLFPMSLVSPEEFLDGLHGVLTAWRRGARPSLAALDTYSWWQKTPLPCPNRAPRVSSLQRKGDGERRKRKSEPTFREGRGRKQKFPGRNGRSSGLRWNPRFQRCC